MYGHIREARYIFLGNTEEECDETMLDANKGRVEDRFPRCSRENIYRNDVTFNAPWIIGKREL